MTTPRGTRSAPGDTASATYHGERTRREVMEQDLMRLGLWLTEHPEAAKKNLKPIRRQVPLEPGVYYNRGTGMVERLYSPQRPSLGGRFFRISSDPAAQVDELRRRVMEGR